MNFRCISPLDLGLSLQVLTFAKSSFDLVPFTDLIRFHSDNIINKSILIKSISI